MKTIIKSIAVGILITFCYACTSTQGTTSEKKEKDYSQYNNLAEILRQQPGLNVVGSGDNVKVYIRGISTIKLNTQPLYVIDGFPIGNEYRMANNSVQPVNIKSVEVIRDKSQVTQYGEQGTNGVILIKTKGS